MIPKGWHVPHPATTAEGRNNELFAALCKLALRCSDDGVLTWARTLNSEFAVSLPESEVRGVWRSVLRYRARWRVDGQQARLALPTGRTGQARGHSVRCRTRGQAHHPQCAVGRHAPQGFLVPRHRTGGRRQPRHGDTSRPAKPCRGWCAKPIQVVPLPGCSSCCSVSA